MNTILRGALAGSVLGGGFGLGLAYGLNKLVQVDRERIKVAALSIGSGVLAGAWTGAAYSCLFVGVSSLLSGISHIAHKALENGSSK